jgi:predicted nucleotidyltransferase
MGKCEQLPYRVHREQDTVTARGFSRKASSSRGAHALALCTVAALVVAQLAGAQAFTDISASIAGVSFGSAAWGDYDNDGDLDILLTGTTTIANPYDPATKIYRNDGGGVFTDIGASLIGVLHGSVAWGDYDNDGDLDILLTGSTDGSGSTASSKIYRNEGSGTFVDIGASLAPVHKSSVAWGDYDNDGDLDILLTGVDDSFRVSRIYRNDGSSTFTDIGAIGRGVAESSVAWGDYDGDGDLDILVTGHGTTYRSEIYRNDGGGAFAGGGTTLKGVRSSSTAWGDYDNDGDLDILLTGLSYEVPTGISKVYRNDGGGSFTEIGSSLVGVAWSSAAWGDYDNDGDLDILLTGSTGYTPFTTISKIYRNDGNGVFCDIVAPLVGVTSSSVAWGDYDNDGDLDILLTGSTGETSVSKVYRNDIGATNTPPTPPTGLHSQPGAGQVTLTWAAASDGQTPAAGLTYNLRVSTTPGGVDVLSPMAWTGTGWRRVVQIGSAQHGVSATLRSLPAGTCYWSVQAVDSALAGSPFAGESSFTFSPASISPTNAAFSPGGGSGSIDVTTSPGAFWTASSDVAWIAVNSGESGSGSGTVGYSVAANLAGQVRVGRIAIAGQFLVVTQLGAFSDTSVTLTGAYLSSVAWGDYDNDGDLDFLLTGDSTEEDFTRLYRNDGSGNFTDAGASLPRAADGSVAWGDYDNDGDLDILLTGGGGSPYGPLTRIYRNDGDGAFTDTSASLGAVYGSSGVWGDYDSDGDLDILLVGSTGSARISKLYRNDGGDAFTDIGASLTGVSGSSAAWGDYDNDGDLDILLAGFTGSAEISKIYRNDGAGTFTDIGATLTGVSGSSFAWGDYDNDGDLDILLTGASGSTRLAKIYRNDGGGAFTEIGAGFTGTSSGSASWADYDDDGDLDVLLTGISDSGRIAKIYRNNSIVANTPPAAPIGLSATVTGDQVTLGWSSAMDDRTPATGLTYNLRVSTTPRGVNILSPMANASTGWRKVVQFGGTQHGNTAMLGPLGNGLYYWSVQAIDSAFAGSPFAPRSSFTVGSCSFGIDPVAVSTRPSGAGGSVTVTANAGCSWTAEADDTWINVTSGESGTGGGSIGYTVSANAGPARIGTITIADETFTVSQAAATYELTVQRSGAGSGVVSSTPSGVGCGADCNETFVFGTVVTLSASAAAGSSFAGWSGEDCAGLGDCQVTMGQARTVSAMFVPSNASSFRPVAPCRVFDTRVASGPGAGAPGLGVGERRMFSIAGSCNIPAGATAISANITVVGAASAGDLIVTAGHIASTVTSVLSIPVSRARANNAVIQLSANGDGTIAITNETAGIVHVILDVNGYFR